SSLPPDARASSSDLAGESPAPPPFTPLRGTRRTRRATGRRSRPPSPALQRRRESTEADWRSLARPAPTAPVLDLSAPGLLTPGFAEGARSAPAPGPDRAERWESGSPL